MTDTADIIKPQSTGEVFTRPEVVDYMLGVVRHFSSVKALAKTSILEPSCGRGAFVLPIVDSFISEVEDWKDPSLLDFLFACDISHENVEYVAGQTRMRLIGAGCPAAIADDLVKAWFACDDFLLHDFNRRFDIVIGNPPYIRFDEIGKGKQAEYRMRFETFKNRCDIYIPFFEKSLSLLSIRGMLSFICSNRFTKNRYGAALRRLISDQFHVALYVNMEHSQPFLEKVSAYPAIFAIDRNKSLPTFSATVADAGRKTLERLEPSRRANDLCRFEKWYDGDAIWTSTCATDKDEAQRIQQTYPTIEDSAPGTKIGIGVATGADEVFLDAQRHADIEPERLLPLVVSDDIKNGVISWQDHYILNPYDPHRRGGMIDLSDYPKTAAYLKRNAERLKSRYCAKGHRADWYRTLDRINDNVFRSAKLLLPDIQAGGNVALDERGEFYPHHNVYWITSSSWSLKALCVILRSAFVTDQMRKVSVRMRGGSVRYQAQNLRNVHIPAWNSFSRSEVLELESLYSCSDRTQVDNAVARIVERVAAHQPAHLTQGELFDVTAAT